MSARSSKTWGKSVFNDLPPPEETTPAKKTRSSTRSSVNKNQSTTNDNKKTQPTTRTTTTTRTTNWIENFAPTCSDDLAVHAKKLTEIQNWFLHCAAMQNKHPTQLCLLTGPSGCGKTATVRTLAKEHNFLVQEWINPTDQEVVHGLDIGEWHDDGATASTYYTSQLEQFKNFLLRASRYRSLLDGNGKRLLLVEDFPNAVIKDAKIFEEILQNYKEYGRAPLIFIATDARTRSLNISYNLFSDEVKARHHITHIQFNSIAVTLMQKAMKRFCSLMQTTQYADTYKVPTADTVDSIALSSQGDIRNALLNLHFASLMGCPQLSMAELATDLSSSVAGGGRLRRKKAQTRTLKSVGRDEAITMMHALGRVFYPKWSDDKKRLLHSPEDIADCFYAEPKKFIDFVHANYMGHFCDIIDIVAASDALSLAETMLTEYRDERLGVCALNVAVRGVMVTNRQPTAGFKAIRGPKRLNTNEAPDQRPAQAKGHISRSLYASDYSTYVKYISKPI